MSEKNYDTNNSTKKPWKNKEKQNIERTKNAEKILECQEKFFKIRFFFFWKLKTTEKVSSKWKKCQGKITNWKIPAILFIYHTLKWWMMRVGFAGEYKELSRVLLNFENAVSLNNRTQFFNFLHKIQNFLWFSSEPYFKFNFEWLEKPITGPNRFTYFEHWKVSNGQQIT